MTSLAEEREEQLRWTLRPRFAGLDVFDRLLENEFLPSAEGDAQETRALRDIVQFAAAEVPYYRDLLARLGLDARDIRDRRDLPRLPPLTRRDLVGNFERLRPGKLPQGVEIHGTVVSSGTTTGQPTQVVCSTWSNLVFSFLNQRHARWHRRDPRRTLAAFRTARNAPQPRPGASLADGGTLRVPQWRYVGTFFETGPNLYFNVSNSPEARLSWLRRERPDYLLAASNDLTHVALVAGERPCDSLRALTAFAEPLTPVTRAYLEAAFGAPVQQGYGLNEIGLVAARCDAGRYHVHREHCVVEIVDEGGVPVAAGRTGRLLVTGLQNPAMPLIRYDSDDLVTAVAGECPCGRTLPSFGEVHGRWSRIVPLPRGTLERVEALRAALLETPARLTRDLRCYRIQRFRDGSHELHIVAAAAMSNPFRERIERAWSAVAGAAGPRLTVRQVADIPVYDVVEKFEDFVSEI